MLCIERNRAERSGRRFVLMVLEPEAGRQHSFGLMNKVSKSLVRATRDTDIKGWYQDGIAVGVIFTEIALCETSIVQVLTQKMTGALALNLSPQELSRFKLSCHVFPDIPDDSNQTGRDSGNNVSTIYPDLAAERESRRIPFLVKRCLDVVGSLIALLLLAPVMALIAAAIKLTSPGPVLFRQIRLGQAGRGFTFLKFRSMHAKSDHAVHEAYIKSFIADKVETPGDSKVFKLQSDSRVTRVGRFIRRTSLDEIPQFFNVLAGHMSLVGPRPPVPYEFANYKVWHRRRLLAVKPGITGVWQVEGRSRVKFDDMVRMDIAYARNWSLWKDILILLKTPAAVFGGNGAC
jgi:lipopolysaccharide/colanic/teichoic acid biosynthesis glycosyltransferase